MDADRDEPREEPRCPPLPGVVRAWDRIRDSRGPDGFAIAYQVVGDGAHDLVYLPGWASNVDVSWDVPPIARFLEEVVGVSLA